MSLAVVPQQWNARSVLHSLFWEVSLRAAGLLSDGRVDPGGMVEEHKGREMETEGDRQLLNRRAEQVLPGPGLSSDIYNKRLKTLLIYWNPLPSLTSQFCWKHGVNKPNQ